MDGQALRARRAPVPGGAIPAGMCGVPQRRDPVRRGERCSETHGTVRDVRPGEVGLQALTWARVALARLPAGSPILLLALPLASAFFALGHLAEDERSARNRLGDGDARQVWSKGLEKSLSPEGKASCRAAWGASPVAFGERRGLGHLERPLPLG